MKKHDLPAMPFYVGDWKKDPGIQVMSYEMRAVWFELILLMWESKERGYLTINGKPMSLQMIAGALNLNEEKTKKLLEYFEGLDLYSKRKSDNAIYSRKILNILNLRKVRQIAGSKGGKQTSSKPQAKPQAKHENETESEIEIESEDKDIIKKQDLRTSKSDKGMYAKVLSLEYILDKSNKYGFNHNKEEIKYHLNNGYSLEDLNLILDKTNEYFKKNKPKKSKKDGWYWFLNNNLLRVQFWIDWKGEPLFPKKG